MKKATFWVAGALAVAGAAGVGVRLHAADHKDGPAATAEPAADITDVYAWMSPDKSKVNLVMDVYPNAPAGAKFSDQVLYVFHLNSAATFGAATPTETKIVCGFDTAQKVTCWVGTAGETVSGDASVTAGINSASAKTKVFAGLRDDPFFFNLTGFKATTAAVAAAASSLTFDGTGCPMLDSTTASTLVAQLAHGTAGAAPANDFAGQNVLSIVIQVDTALVTPGGKFLGVWASTHARA
ncbi:MAG TPA: DUF4331 family protein [Polyangia bacterium]|nr:DUF4331 family protein [Polyangia bacterium]